MKKLIQGYIAIVNLIYLIIYIANLFFNKPTFIESIIFIISLLSIICISFIQFNKAVKPSYILLSVIYFLQCFTVLFSNVTWKLLIGTEFSFYIIRNGDLTTKLDFKVFNIHLMFNTMSNGESWVIGLNFVHILIFYVLCKLILKDNSNVGAKPARHSI